MTVSLKHTFASAKPDSADATIIQPSNWNQEHDLTLATNKVLGRATAGTGAAEELSVGTALSVSGGTLTVTNVPVANGGTGAATLTGYVKGNGTSAFTAAATVPAGDVSGTLGVANGGTGAATLPANNVLIGNGTSAVTSVAPSTAGNVLRSNGTTWTSTAPTVSGSLDAVATGSLSNGSTVVINVDGTVSVVAPVITFVPTAGAEAVFRTNGVTYVSTTYDSVNQKVIIFCYDSTTVAGLVFVGTVSGTTITFGSGDIFNAFTTGVIACTYDANAQKVVVFYKDDNNSSFGTARVGTVSGTSMTFGTAVVFESNALQNTPMSAVYNAAALKVVLSYEQSGGRSIVGTVSGTSISFGTSALFSTSITNISSAYDANTQKVVIAYRHDANSFYGTAIIGTVSGTSISYGTAVVYSSFYTNETATAYDANALKVVIAYANNASGNFGTAIVGTVSGTSISFGTAAVFQSSTTTTPSAVYDAGVQKVVLSYGAGATSIGTSLLGTISGTSISFSTSVVFNNAQTQFIASVYNAAAQKTVVSYRDVGNSSRGTSAVITPTTSTPNLTSENFIGFSSAAYTNGQTATIQLVGSVNTAQSGLTAGQSYFVLTDGTLSLTAGSPSVFAGTAVSATKIIVKG